MLEAGGIPYEETRLRPKEWGAHKKSGGYLFEQLPKATITFEDGSTFDLFQSLTIFRYLARKAGLAGEGELNQARVEMLIDASEDLRQKFAKVCYSPDFEKLRGPYVAETMPVEFGKIENILKSNGTGFLVGSSLTAADLYLFDVVENHIVLATDQFLEPFPLLKKHHETVGSHAKIHAYVASGKRPQFPNGPTAIFGGYKEEATN